MPIAHRGSPLSSHSQRCPSTQEQRRTITKTTHYNDDGTTWWITEYLWDVERMCREMLRDKLRSLHIPFAKFIAARCPVQFLPNVEGAKVFVALGCF